MGLISQEVIAQVLDRCDIVDVVSSYIPLKKAGRDFKALCPFHNEKTPSFVVSQDKQIFHCFGCGLGGNAISFVMNQEHVEFPEAVRILGSKVGIHVTTQETAGGPSVQVRQQLKKINELAVEYYHRNLLFDRNPEARAAREYLKQRGVSLDTAKELSLGLAFEHWDGLMNFLRQKGISTGTMAEAGLIIARNDGSGHYDRFRNRIMFPIFDTQNRCLAFGARALDKDNPAKYLNSPETSIYTKGRHLYGFHIAKEAISQADQVLVVEGYMDFLTPFQHGVRNIVASLGTALTVGQTRLIRRYTDNVILSFDTDRAGEAAMLRSIDLLIEEGLNVRVATLSDKDDPDSYIRKNGVEAFKERLQKAESFFDYKLRSVTSKYGDESIEAKAKIAEEILPTINRFKNAIVKSEYIKRLARILAISEEALLMELKVLSQGTAFSGLSSEIRQEQVALKNQIRPVEREILKLMLEEKSFITLTKEVVSLSDFQNQYVRKVVEKMFEISDKGGEPTLPVLMSSIEDQHTLQMITALAASEEMVVIDKHRVHRDCINRLRQERLRLQRKQLLRQMELARGANDHKKLDELTREFNELIKNI